MNQQGPPHHAQPMFFHPPPQAQNAPAAQPTGAPVPNQMFAAQMFSQPGAAVPFHQMHGQWPQLMAGSGMPAMQFPGNMVASHGQSHPGTPQHQPYVHPSDPAAFFQFIQAPPQAEYVSFEVPFTIEDEHILVNALREGRAQGLTPRGALERLHTVNMHTASDWKNHFIEHLERFYTAAYHVSNIQTVYLPMQAQSDITASRNSSISASSYRPGYGTAIKKPRRPTPSERSSDSESSAKNQEANLDSSADEDSDDGNEDEDEDHSDDGGNTSPEKRTGPKPKSSIRRTKVTEADLRAMGKFMAEHGPCTDKVLCSSLFWKILLDGGKGMHRHDVIAPELMETIPQNAKRRTTGGWMRAVRRKKDILKDIARGYAKKRKNAQQTPAPPSEEVESEHDAQYSDSVPSGKRRVSRASHNRGHTKRVKSS